MTDTTNNTNSEEFSTMTDEELQAQLEAIQAELGRRKWAKVDDLMPHVEALTDEELAEFSNRVLTLKSARDRKVQEMTEATNAPQRRTVKTWNPAEFAAEPGDLLNRKPEPRKEKKRMDPLECYKGMTTEEIAKQVGRGIS